MNNSFVLGITGCSGSGKTHFLNSLMEHFPTGSISLISQDNYYLPRQNQPVDKNGIKNFDLPESINLDQFSKDIIAVKGGEIIERDEYTYNNPNKKSQKVILKPAPILIIEGIFIFSFHKIKELVDLTVYIDAKDHIRLKRRIIRDNEERGYDLEDVLYRYENHVIPTFEKYIAPFRSQADIIIPNDRNFEGALNVLISFLRTKLSS